MSGASSVQGFVRPGLVETTPHDACESWVALGHIWIAGAPGTLRPPGLCGMHFMLSSGAPFVSFVCCVLVFFVEILMRDFGSVCSGGPPRRELFFHGHELVLELV